MRGRSLQSRFQDAWDGVKDAVRTQSNMRLHLAAAVVVLAAGAFFQVGAKGFVYLVLAISLVLICEIINTAIEAAVDLCVKDFHPGAKRAKHLAAGAVLVAAANAVVVGLLVFYDPLFRLLRGLNAP